MCLFKFSSRKKVKLQTLGGCPVKAGGDSRATIGLTGLPFLLEFTQCRLPAHGRNTDGGPPPSFSGCTRNEWRSCLARGYSLGSPGEQTPLLIQEVTLLPPLRLLGLQGHSAGFSLNPVLGHAVFYLPSAFLLRAYLDPGRPMGHPQSLLPSVGTGWGGKGLWFLSDKGWGAGT